MKIIISFDLRIFLICPFSIEKYNWYKRSKIFQPLFMLDIENHIAIFHHIPKRVLRLTLKGGNNSLFIMKETVAVKDED